MLRGFTACCLCAQHRVATSLLVSGGVRIYSRRVIHLSLLCLIHGFFCCFLERCQRGDAFVQPSKLAWILFARLSRAFLAASTPSGTCGKWPSRSPKNVSKELFRQYCRPGGPLLRRPGASMKQSVSRRRRCWTQSVQMDPVIFLSDGHCSEMLLDLSCLTHEERVMIQASTGKERNFDRVAEALIIQNPRMHLLESGRHTARDTRTGNGKSRESSVHGGGCMSRWSRRKPKVR